LYEHQIVVSSKERKMSFEMSFDLEKESQSIDLKFEAIFIGKQNHTFTSAY
jgi:hypothetical protein